MPEWIERKVTLGNVINLVTLVFAAAGFYWTTTLTLESHARDIKAIFDRGERMEARESAERERIRTEFAARAERTSDQQNLLIQRTIAVEVELKGVRSDLQRLFAKIDTR